jgi:VanZ family protein
LAKAFALVFLVFLLVVICWAASGNMPLAFRALYDFPHGDKLGHFLLMGCLSLLVNLALGGHAVQVGPWRVLAGSLLVALFVSLEEMLQYVFPRRMPDFWDWAASMLGVILAGLIVWKFKPLK